MEVHYQYTDNELDHLILRKQQEIARLTAVMNRLIAIRQRRQESRNERKQSSTGQQTDTAV